MRYDREDMSPINPPSKYQFVVWKKEYLTLAQAEIERLRLSLTTPQVRLEHFGSTAVAGLSGKGIIDIMLVLPALPLEAEKEPVEEINQLRAAGYVYHPTIRLTQQRWFLDRLVETSPGQVQRYHLHVLKVLPGEIPYELRFRDYVREHPDDRQRYEMAKRAAVRAAARQVSKEAQKEAYISTKDPVIKEIMAKIEAATGE